jgi:hypothetical protein
MNEIEWGGGSGDFDDVFRQIVEQQVARLRLELTALRCPVHGEAPELIVTRQDANGFSADIHGCCEELARLTRIQTAELGFENDDRVA